MYALDGQFLLTPSAAISIVSMSCLFFFTFNNNETEKKLDTCEISAQEQADLKCYQPEWIS